MLGSVSSKIITNPKEIEQKQGEMSKNFACGGLKVQKGLFVKSKSVQSLTTKMINHNSGFFHQPIPLIILVGYHFSG